jgi:phenylalanyl-tRNA synthetase beta subunit
MFVGEWSHIMKISTSWINSWLGRTISEVEIVEALESAGLEIEQFTYSKSLDEKIIVALVKKVVQHPDADLLKIVTITTGDNEAQIVCGALNVREGLNVALAQIGSILPDGSQIKASKLRGQMSHGMLCSGQELGLNDDRDGLLELDSKIPLSTKLSDVFPADGLLDVKTHANRSDLQSVIGLAREVSAMTDSGLKALPAPHKISSEGPQVTHGAIAARYELTEVEVDASLPTPDIISARLRGAGMRPVSIVVDITNYVMLEIGHPLHAFDADKVELPISVRYALKGEEIKTLDGKLRKLTELDLVIADQSGPIAMSGVMGGEATEVSSSTRRIYLESAVFEASVVRKMAKRHNLRSEASARFERGLPVQLPPLSSSLALDLLKAHAGAVEHGTTDQLNVWPWTQRIGLRVSKLSSLMGFDLKPKEAISALGRLGIETRQFDIAAEASIHLGKPYRLGASFKTDGIEAFDCSYLVDYLYSMIGMAVGFTALGQYEIGIPVKNDDQLLPGDVVFYEGLIETSVTDHYFMRGSDGIYVKHEVKPPRRVGHNGLYVGNGRVIMAAKFEWKNGSWEPLEKSGVVDVPLELFTENPGYLGARRFAEKLDDFISVAQVPWWRTDLKLAEDLVEEVVRVIGYDRIPSTIPAWRPNTLQFDRDQQLKNKLQAILTGAGLFEVMTYSFVGKDQLTLIGADSTLNLKLKNPLSSEQAYLRSSLLPSHLNVLAKNRQYSKSFGYYEMSKVFISKNKEKQPLEPLRLGITVMRAEKAYTQIKGLLDIIGHTFGLEIELERKSSVQGFADNRVGTILMSGIEAGIIGQIQPSILRELKVSSEVAYLELDLGQLFTNASILTYKGKQRFPTAERDLTFFIDEQVDWQSIVKALEKLEHTTISYIGDYYGKDTPSGQKSLTLHFVLGFDDHTPTESETAGVQNRIISTLMRAFKITTP